MTKDDIARMTREAGIVVTGEAVWKLCELVAAAEREACAQVCISAWPDMHKYWGPGQARAACEDCANAIRARGNK